MVSRGRVLSWWYLCLQRDMRIANLAIALAFLAAPAIASASGRSIHAEPMAGEKIRVDGDLREWPAKMTDLTETLQGSASGGDPKAGVVLGYDDASLYCVMRVGDKKLVRTSAAGSSEDHATL